jgi:hypothetical protein
MRPIKSEKNQEYKYRAWRIKKKACKAEGTVWEQKEVEVNKRINKHLFVLQWIDSIRKLVSINIMEPYIEWLVIGTNKQVEYPLSKINENRDSLIFFSNSVFVYI